MTMTKTINGKWDSELARLSTYWSARNGKCEMVNVRWDSELARLSTYGAQEMVNGKCEM